MILKPNIPGKISFARIASIVICGGIAVLPALAAADEDPVFRRYEKKVIPSKLIKLDAAVMRVALDHPATNADVKAGRAIFTLEGLGESRVWKMPRCPIPATWTTLKQFPKESADGSPAFANYGHVLQAEELLVNGKWQRYFGWVTARGVAVAPAGEVDLWLSPSENETSWMCLSDGLDWGVKFGATEKTKILDPFSASSVESGKLAVADPLPVEGFIMNCRGVARQVPTDFYHNSDQGGPSLRKGVRLILERAPFDPRAADPNYPNDADYKPMISKSLGVFDPQDRAQVMETGESFRVFTADLHDWFDIHETGYYQFRIEFDGPKGDRGCTQTGFGFCLGAPPPVFTVEQLNKEIPPLGDKDAEAKIRKLIKETCISDLSDTAGKQEIVWSEAVGGLQAVILDFTQGYRDDVVLVGLKNVSDKPLTVPVSHPENHPRAGLFDLQVRNDGGEWKSVKKFSEHKESEQSLWKKDEDPDQQKSKKLKADSPLTFKLSPGKVAVVYLNGDYSPMIKADSEVRIVLHQTAATAASGAWQGRINTPPVPAFGDDEMVEKLKGSLDFPEFFPNFDTRGFWGGNMSGHETDVSRLRISNGVLLEALDLFKESEVRKEFEHRFTVENDMPMKLLDASVAVGRGSQLAALCLLEMMKETDYDTIRNLHNTLGQIVYQHGAKQPAWLLAMVKAALSDERFLTGLEKANFDSNTRLKISYLADEDGDLALTLGEVKCPEAVPYLIERVVTNKGSKSIWALGATGDPRAIPILLDVLKRDGKTAKYESGAGLSPETFSRAIGALASLHATEAVPALIDYSQYPEVIEALNEIGDRRAVPVLREMVQNEGRVIRDGKELNPKEASARLIKSKIVLATLEEGDAIPRLCALLNDKSFGKYDRRDVIWKLGEQPDPRAIPFLIKLIKTDPSGSVVNQAINVLSAFKYKAAVEGLIDCFDTNFVGKSDWKRAYEPEMFQENIAESLRSITGRKIGLDKKKWLNWWQSEGKSTVDLK